MPEDTNREERALEKLSEAVRSGWAEKHPVSEKARLAVRSALQREEKEKKRSIEERRKKAEEKQRQLLEEMKQTQERGRSR
jgi:hypothetical protein